MRLYICPTPGCGNYFGSSSMPNLATSQNHAHAPWSASNAGEYRAVGTRDECPDCKAQGRTVRRELREVVVR